MSDYNNLKRESQTGGLGDWWRTAQKRRAKLKSSHVLDRNERKKQRKQYNLTH